MYNFEFIKDGKKWHRVNKRVARKAFNTGMVVHLTTSRAYPGSVLGSCDIQLPTKPDPFNEFDDYVNSFKFYNCNAEMGNNVNYYIENVEV
nr:MAG TPA: hypothetical protein [Caudoviricetes sp.]